jgi:hypothetical protein
MDKKKRWQRSRSLTAKVESASVLVPLKFFSLKAKSFEQRMAFFTKRWQKRVQEFGEFDVFTPAMLKAATLCPPCSMKGTNTWPCDLRFCPFCFARDNAEIFQRWRQQQGEVIVSFNDLTFAAVALTSTETRIETIASIKRCMDRWRYKLRDSLGGVLRLIPVPMPEDRVWSFRIGGVAIYDGSPPIFDATGNVWLEGSSNAAMTGAIARTMSYPQQWMYGSARRVASMYRPLKRMRFIKYFGSLYSRNPDVSSPALPDESSAAADDLGNPDCGAFGGFDRLLESGCFDGADCGAERLYANA